MRGQLHGSVTCSVPPQYLTFGRALCVVECPAVALMKFLIIFEQRTPHFHFTLGPPCILAGYTKRARKGEGLPRTENTVCKTQEKEERIVLLKSWLKFCVTGARSGRWGIVRGELGQQVDVSCQAGEQ